MIAVTCVKSTALKALRKGGANVNMKVVISADRATHSSVSNMVGEESV